MERNDETTSLSLVQNAAQRGAGGKLRKSSSRKPQTPYARPQQQSRWLSKLVDPAYRLISGGATRFLPSLFSSYISPQHSLPASSDQQEDEDREILSTEEEEECAEANAGLNHGKSRSTDVAGPSSIADKSNNGSDFDGCKQDKRGDTTDNDRLSEIEQLLKGKSFSRDEIHRLIDIIHSRAVDLPEQEDKYLSMTVKGDAERLIVALENPRKSTEEKQEDLSKTPWGTSTIPLQSSVSRIQDTVGASPIDIAKAYMGTRTSEVGLGSKSLLTKDERASPNGAEFALKQYIPSSLRKPSTCWPGAMSQDQRDYLTPRSESGRCGLRNFPRTPYSRTIFSKSKSKSKLTQLQGDGNRGLNTPTPLQQSQTPIYERSRRIALDNGHGSVGPIRRIRHKVAAESPASGSVNFHSSVNGLSPVGNSNFPEGFFPTVKKNLELGGTSGSSIFQSVGRKLLSSEVGFPPVHPHSSQMARTIVEHLDSNPPTPKDKSAELKLATSWKKPQPSHVTTSMPIEQNSFLNLGGIGSSKKADEGDKKNSSQVNEARLNSFFKVPPQENNKASKDGVNETTSTSGKTIDHIFTIQQGGSIGSSHNFGKTPDFEIKSKNENETLPNAADGEVLTLQRKPPSHSVGTKPVSTPNSVSKHGQRWTFGSENSTGFSFPVSAYTWVSSEPPTPSIMPSIPASDVYQPKEGYAVPSYSFGLNRSTSRLVFAFPSTSSASTNDMASDLKFNLGSDKTTRICFSSIGKHAIC